jgi:hypothetical protein
MATLVFIQGYKLDAKDGELGNVKELQSKAGSVPKSIEITSQDILCN